MIDEIINWVKTQRAERADAALTASTGSEFDYGVAVGYHKAFRELEDFIIGRLEDDKRRAREDDEDQ